MGVVRCRVPTLQQVLELVLAANAKKKDVGVIVQILEPAYHQAANLTSHTQLLAALLAGGFGDRATFAKRVKIQAYDQRVGCPAPTPGGRHHRLLRECCWCFVPFWVIKIEETSADIGFPGAECTGRSEVFQRKLPDRAQPLRSGRRPRAVCTCQGCGCLTPEEQTAAAPAGGGVTEVGRGAAGGQVLGSVAQHMETLGLKPRGSLVWMVHCSKTRVSDQQLAAWSKVGGAIAPEKVPLRLPRQAPCLSVCVYVCGCMYVHLYLRAPTQLCILFNGRCHQPRAVTLAKWPSPTVCSASRH